MTLQELKTIPRVTTEKEFYDALKIFNSSIGNITTNIKLFTGSPIQFLSDFNSMLDEGVRIGVINNQFADEKKSKLVKQLNNPTKFKSAMSRRLLQLKNLVSLKKKKDENRK